MNDDDSTSEEGVDAFTRVSMRRAVRSGVGRVVGSSQGAYYRPTDGEVLVLVFCQSQTLTAR